MLFYEERKSIMRWILDEVAPMILKLFFKPKQWPYTIEDYRNFPKGSLANDIANYLDDKGFGFIDNAEHHDIRHILLGYDMHVIDEIRMQFFMLGNGKWKWSSKILAIEAILILPELIDVFIRDYHRGKASKDITQIDWVRHLKTNTQELKDIYGIQPIFFETKLCNSKYF